MWNQANGAAYTAIDILIQYGAEKTALARNMSIRIKSSAMECPAFKCSECVLRDPELWCIILISHSKFTWRTLQAKVRNMGYRWTEVRKKMDELSHTL